MIELFSSDFLACYLLLFVVSLSDNRVDKIVVAALHLFYKTFLLVFDTVSQDSAIGQYSETPDRIDSYREDILYIYRNSLQHGIACSSKYIDNRNILQYKRYQVLQLG